jgi:alkanesulfonate monooxygenase SsuD/methylene tetrahydromethanopterin reductase-like flavin-dependent oxidoreductase (luciferase family)
VPFSTIEDTRAAFGRVREACQAAGRDPDSLVYSAAQTVCCGRDEAELARRAAAIGWDLATQRADGLVGTPDEIVDRIGTLAGLGVTRVYLQVMDLHDLDHLELIAAEVLPQVR